MARIPISTPLAALRMSPVSMPTSGQSVVIVGVMAVALGTLCVGTAAILIHRQRRHAARELDLEANAEAHVKNGLNGGLRMPTLSRLPDGLQLPARAKIAASSRLRDSVLGRAIGQLSWPEAGKVKRTPLTPVQEEQVVDIEAIAGLDKPTDVVDEAYPETTMSFPDWVCPHHAEFREQAQKEWNIYLPGTGLVTASSLPTTIAIPDIVVESPTDPQLELLSAACSADSIYSQESWDGDHSEAFDIPLSPRTPELDASSLASSPEVDSPVLETPTMEAQIPPQFQATLFPAVSKAVMSTEASSYWPLIPSFSAMEHLQVPPSIWNGPVSEELEVTTVSMSSGKPFMLHSPTQSRRSTTVFGQSLSSASVGLGLQSRTSGTLGAFGSLSEALDVWTQEMETCEPFAFRVASDSRGGLAYDDADGRTTRSHPLLGYGYL